MGAFAVLRAAGSRARSGGGLGQNLGHPPAPIRTFGSEILHSRRIETQGHSFQRRLELRSTVGACGALGEHGKDFSEWAELGDLIVGQFRIVRCCPKCPWVSEFEGASVLFFYGLDDHLI